MKTLLATTYRCNALRGYCHVKRHWAIKNKGLDLPSLRELVSPTGPRNKLFLPLIVFCCSIAIVIIDIIIHT